MKSLIKKRHLVSVDNPNIVAIMRLNEEEENIDVVEYKIETKLVKSDSYRINEMDKIKEMPVTLFNGKTWKTIYFDTPEFAYITKDLFD